MEALTDAEMRELANVVRGRPQTYPIDAMTKVGAFFEVDPNETEDVDRCIRRVRGTIRHRMRTMRQRGAFPEGKAWRFRVVRSIRNRNRVMVVRTE